MCTFLTVILSIVNAWDPRVHSEHCYPWTCALEGLKMSQKESKYVALK